MTNVCVIGAGLAGSEAVWQLAQRGIAVSLYEMRPARMTEAHQSGECAELVCSNSFKSLNRENAHGLLKAELEARGSLIMAGARLHAVPAGQALAVDREKFSPWIGSRLRAHPLIEFVREEAQELGSLLSRYDAVVMATGPLTSSALASSLAELVGDSWLYFHDAIAPVVHADSIDATVAFPASRYDKGDADYLNLPLNADEYHRFVKALLEAEKIEFHDFESLRPFEGCLPIEVMAERGALTLAYGPMKPVGLVDPRSGRRPFAAIQLRRENTLGDLFGMVGFQTKMTWPEQRRVFRSLPGLEQARFARLGSLHRNTFLDAPKLLAPDLSLRTEPALFIAGQLTGVEGYMESTAMGLLAAHCAAARVRGQAPILPSAATMSGALLRYVTSAPAGKFQPMNASFGLVEPLAGKHSKKERKTLYAARAMAEIVRLIAGERNTSLAPAPGITS